MQDHQSQFKTSSTPSFITQSRVHRLLRQLRAALKNVSTDLKGLNKLKEEERIKVEEKNERRRTRLRKVKMRLLSDDDDDGSQEDEEEDEDDDDWFDGSESSRRKKKKQKKRRKSSIRSNYSTNRITTTYSRSQRINRLGTTSNNNPTTTTTRIESQLVSTTTTTTNTSIPKSRRRIKSRRRSTGSSAAGGISLLLDARNRLIKLDQGGWEQDLVNKALHLVKTYSNIIELVVVVVPNDDQSKFEMDQRGDGDENFAHFQLRQQPLSLVELLSRDVGWNLEANILKAREEEREENRSSSGSGSGMDTREGSPIGTRRKAELDEGADEQMLMDEWYEICPDYCRRWILIEHATSIVIEGLENPPFELLEILYELCFRMGAITTSSRFYDALNFIALPLSNPTSNAFTLAQHAVLHGQSQIYAESLGSTLLESSFEDRLFYSPFLPLCNLVVQPHHQLHLLTDAKAFALIMEVICDVGQKMILVIQNSMIDDVKDKSGKKWVLEIIQRINVEFRTAIKFFLDDDSKRIIEDAFNFIINGSNDQIDYWNQLGKIFIATSDFMIVCAKFDQVGLDLLGPLTIKALLGIYLGIGFVEFDSMEQQTIIDLDRILSLRFSNTLDCYPSSDTNDEEEEEDYLDSLLHTYTLDFNDLIKRNTSQTFFSIVDHLHSKGLRTLERIVLYIVMMKYDDLSDVRATKGLQVLKKDVFAIRLKGMNPRGGRSTRRIKSIDDMNRLVDVEVEGIPKDKPKTILNVQEHHHHLLSDLPSDIGIPSSPSYLAKINLGKNSSRSSSSTFKDFKFFSSPSLKGKGIGTLDRDGDRESIRSHGSSKAIIVGGNRSIRQSQEGSDVSNRINTSNDSSLVARQRAIDHNGRKNQTLKRNTSILMNRRKVTGSQRKRRDDDEDDDTSDDELAL